MYKYILFDLDGTLTDPMLGITNSVIYALDKFGIRVENRAELYKFIGPPLLDSFMEYYGFSEEKARQAIAYYREYFSVTGLFENEIYESVPELLQQLKSEGKCIILATSKPEKFAKEILKHFDLHKYFDFVAGADMEGRLATKADVIEYALKGANISDRENALMIGDRDYDIIGAKKTGLASLGVLYGYGTKEELLNSGADYIASSPKEILKYI